MSTSLPRTATVPTRLRGKSALDSTPCTLLAGVAVLRAEAKEEVATAAEREGVAEGGAAASRVVKSAAARVEEARAVGWESVAEVGATAVGEVVAEREVG